MYTPHDLFLSCFITKHSILSIIYFSPLSVHNTAYHPALFLTCFSTQHCISPTLNFSPVSEQNTFKHPRSIYHLLEYKTLYIIHALFLTYFSKQNCIEHPLKFSRFSTQHCISPTIYFSPGSVHNTVNQLRSISLMFLYTTL